MSKEDGLVKKLRDRLNRATRNRLAKELAEQPFKDRLIDIFTAPRSAVNDFYCTVCRKDCTGTGYRQVCTINETYPTAWYVGTCPNGHKMIRRITDKAEDPYYNQSPLVARQRHELKDAFLSPDDPRFKELYPKQYKELMAKKK